MIQSYHFHVRSGGYSTTDETWGSSYVEGAEPFFKCFWIVQGKGFIDDGIETHELIPHQIYFINMHKVKRYVCEDNMRLFYIHFKPEDTILEKILKEENALRSWPVREVDPQQNFIAIEKIYNSSVEKRFFYIHDIQFDIGVIAAQIKLQKMIIDVVDRIVMDPADVWCYGNAKASRIKPSVLYMDKNYCSMPKVNILADMSDLSPEYFISLFKKTFNKTPYQYMLDKRMTKAKQLLRYDSARVKEVAKECGYKDEFHFSKTFKKSTGINPKAYATDPQTFDR